jgi:hypothetical protein
LAVREFKELLVLNDHKELKEDKELRELLAVKV